VICLTNSGIAKLLTSGVIDILLTNIIGDITIIIGYITKVVGGVMLVPIVGSRSNERVFIFLVARETGYATEIAKFFDADLYAIQRQLERLERAEVLVSINVGRTRVFQFNPRYPFLNELKGLISRVLSYYPDVIKEELLMNRRRPRKKDKPL
jgi:hypothetical protein